MLKGARPVKPVIPLQLITHVRLPPATSPSVLPAMEPVPVPDAVAVTIFLVTSLPATLSVPIQTASIVSLPKSVETAKRDLTSSVELV